jgi:hypothetical protein
MLSSEMPMGKGWNCHHREKLIKSMASVEKVVGDGQWDWAGNQWKWQQLCFFWEL